MAAGVRESKAMGRVLLVSMITALRACERCPQMHKPVVVGRPVTNRILLVGHAPGDKDPQLGRPFV